MVVYFLQVICFTKQNGFMSKLLALFKKHGIIAADTPDEKLKQMETDLDAIEKMYEKASAPLPKADEDAKQIAIPPELQATIDKLAQMQEQLTASMGTVVKSVETQNSEKEAAAKTALKTRYTTHVEKLATEGKITKAQKDEFLKAESEAKNLASIDVFEATTAMLPVQAALKPKTEPAQHQVGTGGNEPQFKSQKQLEAEALAELTLSMK